MSLKPSEEQIEQDLAQEGTKIAYLEKQKRLQWQLQQLIANLHQWESDTRNGYVGRVLTITDAALTDPDQRKAVRDLVMPIFWGNKTLSEHTQIQEEVEGLGRALGIRRVFEEDDVPEYDFYRQKYEQDDSMNGGQNK